MDSNTNNTGPSVPQAPAPSDPNGSSAPTQPPAPIPSPAPDASPAPENTAANPLTSGPSISMGKSDKPVDPKTDPNGSPAINGASSSTPPSAHHKGKPMMWVIILLIFSFVCGLLLAAWYFQTQLQKASPTAQTTQAPITTPKAIVIGTDATFQPMEYTASTGALMGYDIDLGKQIGEEMGATVTFKIITWDDLFKDLEAKKIDMIMSSVTITDERKKQYDFSDSYLNAGQVIITRRNATAISSAADLQGKKIAVQEGTTNETEARKLTSADMVISYPDFEQATKALVDGKADAILSDLPGAKGIITANPTLKITSDPLTNEYYGIVFRKGDPNVKKINEILSSLRIQGILTDLKQKWLD